MASLIQHGNYGAIYTVKTTKNWSDVIKLISEAYTLQNNTTITGRIISTGQLVVKAHYIWSIKENSNWYWKNNHCNRIPYFQHA